jgi:hypothetical protein
MLRIEKTWHLLKRSLASQSTARTNAAEAIVVLSARREEQVAVDAYLHSQRLTPSLTPRSPRAVVRMETDASCDHDWAVILQRETWSGPMTLSRCSSCQAVLRDWGSASDDPAEATQGHNVV